jgi:glycosyltransferase involved in cell wall biosynthesis
VGSSAAEDGDSDIVSSKAEAEKPALLVLDAAYTLEMIRERGLENSILCRDLDGFFRHVWSVHPFATLLTSEGWTARFGRPVSHELGPRHTFLEGKIGRFPALKSVFPLNFLLAQAGLFFDLLRLIPSERIRVIRVGDPLYLGLFGLMLARLSRIPLVIRVNGNNQKIRETTGSAVYPRLFRSRWLEERVERFVLPRADLIAAPNQDNVDYAISFGARPDRVTIFPYGNLLADEHLVDPARRVLDENLFRKLGVRPGEYLLSVARLAPPKCPEDILAAFATVRSAGFGVDLVYAGEGPMWNQLAAEAAALGLADHVHFIGNQNQRSLAQLNAHAAAVLSPLTGRALSESALGAAPIVAYDLDWQGDLIRTGESGELVPFRHPELMAESAIKLLRDRNYARRMGQGARARALEMLDPATLNEHERQEYAKLLARRNGTRRKTPIA